MRTKLFRSGNSVAIRIPKQMLFDPPCEEVEIERIGDTLVIRPERKSPAEVPKILRSFSPGFMAQGREFHEPPEREGWPR